MRGMCARGRASQTRPTQEPSPQVARPSLWGEKVVMGSRYGRPSLLNHSRRLASCRAPRKLPCATTLSSLDAAVVTRRRRRVTSFALPSGGAPTGASLRTSTDSLSNDGGPGAEYADCADCGPHFPPLRPCAPRRATGYPTPIATTVAPARVPPGPGRQHVGPDHRLMCDVYRCACGNKSVHDRVYF